jgi:hypothetical protein
VRTAWAYRLSPQIRWSLANRAPLAKLGPTTGVRLGERRVL